MIPVPAEAEKNTKNAMGKPKDPSLTQDESSLDLSSLISLPQEQPEDPPSEFATSEEPSVETPLTEENLFTSEPVVTDSNNNEDLEPIDLAAMDSPSVELPGPSSIPTHSAVLDEIKEFSENLTSIAPAGEVAFPFTLKIEGALLPEEKEKLLTILNKENMGIREVDLEHSLSEGNILIPRISEYAGVILIQALRGISAKITFAPSDQIDNSFEITRNAHFLAHSADEQIIELSTHSEIPGIEILHTIDVLVESATLSTRAAEAQDSQEYLLLIEGLKRQIRARAKRLGAQAVVSIQITMTPLTLPTDYRVTLTGTAVQGHSSL
jgi:hypothetical protein